MPIVASRRKRFSSSGLYRHKEAHAFHYLSERTTFWLAIVSVFAFVSGNMMGQHGWHVFWASVWGNEIVVAYDGTVSPIAQVPDYAKWAKYGGNVRENTFRQVPRDALVPLPAYDSAIRMGSNNVYFVDHLGTYATGAGQGSHPGMDIAAPEGTPVRSIMAGVVTRVENDQGGYGNYIVVKHSNVPDPDDASKKTTLHSVYAHLQSVLVTVGDAVQKGDEIGATGQTGLASGPHLHFQIDRDEAPWHPYWPFSSADARKAGLTFNQAVNSGFGRENGLKYTTHPMLYVQGHTQDIGTPTVVSNPEPAASKATKVRLTAEDRKKARMARRGITETTIVAFNDPLPVTPIITTPSTTQVSHSSSVPAVPVQQAIVTAHIQHDGSSSGRERERVRISLLDASGNVIVAPTFERTLELRTAFGRAEFFPTSLKPSDFKEGTAEVEMLLIGQQTVVIQLQPIGTLAKPMTVER